MSDGERKRVLIVEDEAVVALDIADNVRQLGYDVVATTPMAEEAVEIAHRERPDLVLMDIRLKGPMDGIEAGGQIGRTLGLPVLYLTAHADRETLARARDTMPFGYLLKPFDENKLRVALDLALARHASEQIEGRHRRDLRAILDTVPIGALLLDRDGSVAYANAVAIDMLSLDEDNLGRDWEGSLPLDSATLKLLGLQIASPEARERRFSFVTPAPRRRALEVEVAEDPREGHGTILFFRDVSEVEALRAEIGQSTEFEQMVGDGDDMRRVFQLIDDLARVDSSVLIFGETGTGKELVARALHRRSDRAEAPFVAVNCGGLSEELAASQLFGHVRGSFTGAVSDHTGHFEKADGGVLFLDEVAELSERVQAGLLRVLEEQQIVRLGESHPRKVDVRLVAATHRDLDQEIREGRFRADLYYRIRVAQIDLPPLCERRGDIPLLADRFLTRANARTSKSVREIPEAVLGTLLDYAWPGNVRELRNAIEFAVVRSRGPALELHDLPPEVVEIDPAALGGATEEERIVNALTRARGQRKRAAELLGMSRATFYRRLKEYGIDPRQPSQIRAD